MNPELKSYINNILLLSKLILIQAIFPMVGNINFNYFIEEKFITVFNISTHTTVIRQIVCEPFALWVFSRYVICEKLTSVNAMFQKKKQLLTVKSVLNCLFLPFIILISNYLIWNFDSNFTRMCFPIFWIALSSTGKH